MLNEFHEVIPSTTEMFYCLLRFIYGVLKMCFHFGNRIYSDFFFSQLYNPDC